MNTFFPSSVFEKAFNSSKLLVILVFVCVELVLLNMLKERSSTEVSSESIYSRPFSLILRAKIVVVIAIANNNITRTLIKKNSLSPASILYILLYFSFLSKKFEIFVN